MKEKFILNSWEEPPGEKIIKYSSADGRKG